MDKMPSPGDMSDQGHQWLEHFKSEFDSKSFCDATLVSAEGKEFHVHRIILATRSPYFRALFTSPLGGDQAPVLDKITLPDIDSCTLQTILNYIYTGTLKEITEATFVPVIRALDRLQVDGGLHLCHQALIRAINRTNCVIIFQLSRTYFAPTVETESKSFLLREFTTIPSHILDELDGPEFYELISDDRLNVRREEQTFEAIKCWTAANQAERMTFFSPLLKMVRFGNAGLRFIENIVLNDPLVQLDATLKPYLEGAQAVLYDIQANPLPSKFDIVAHPFLRPRIPRDIIFVFGGWSASSASSVLESYDCRVNKWYQATVPDSRPRAYHGMVNFNGSIYIVGGFDGRNHFSSVSAFDPSTKKWTIRANMNQARCYVSVAALDGHVFAIGGYDGQNRTESTERYNPVENQWTLVASMNQQRSDAAVAVLDGKIYVVGGFDGTEVLQSVELYDPQLDEWTLIESMLRPRSGVQCVAHDGCLYVFGGNDGVMRQTSCEKFDPVTRTWTLLADMKTPRSNFAAVGLEGFIYIIGGFNGVTTINEVECYDPKANQWQEMWSMNLQRSALSACVFSSLPNAQEYTWLKRELRPVKGTAGATGRRSPRRRPSGRS